MNPEVRDCFADALRDENKGRKHKGLLIVSHSYKAAEGYIRKAKLNLELCRILMEKGFDYKIPEEWFYTLYYCALAILAKFGIESRSQRCTAAFLRYAKRNKLIDYDDEFIERIMVYRDKEEFSDVDQRENARYSSSIKSEDVKARFDSMSFLCLNAISQAEEIVFSSREFKVPKEIFEYS